VRYRRYVSLTSNPLISSAEFETSTKAILVNKLSDPTKKWIAIDYQPEIYWGKRAIEQLSFDKAWQ